MPPKLSFWGRENEVVWGDGTAPSPDPSPASHHLGVSLPLSEILNTQLPFGMEKLEWCGYPMVKKFRRYVICFDMIHERDKQTDRQTDGRTDGQTLHDGIDRAYA